MENLKSPWFSRCPVLIDGSISQRLEDMHDMHDRQRARPRGMCSEGEVMQKFSEVLWTQLTFWHLQNATHCGTALSHAASQMMSLFAESRVETHSEKKNSPDGRSGSPWLGMSGGPARLWIGRSQVHVLQKNNLLFRAWKVFFCWHGKFHWQITGDLTGEKITPLEHGAILMVIPCLWSFFGIIRSVWEIFGSIPSVHGIQLLNFQAIKTDAPNAVVGRGPAWVLQHRLMLWSDGCWIKQLIPLERMYRVDFKITYWFYLMRHF